MSVVHRRRSRINSTRINELSNNIGIILEVGFDGKGLDLLEQLKRGAFGKK